MIDLVRFCVLYVYSIVVFRVYMYSVSAQGIVGRVINARYYYYYFALGSNTCLFRPGMRFLVGRWGVKHRVSLRDAAGILFQAMGQMTWTLSKSVGH